MSVLAEQHDARATFIVDVLHSRLYFAHDARATFYVDVLHLRLYFALSFTEQRDCPCRVTLTAAWTFENLVEFGTKLLFLFLTVEQEWTSK
jgi:hypothetical protein